MFLKWHMKGHVHFVGVWVQDEFELFCLFDAGINKKTEHQLA